MLVHTHIPPGTLVAYRATDDRVGHGRDRITVRLETRSDALARRYVSSGYTANNPLGQAHSLEANEAQCSHPRGVSQEGELQLCQ